MNINGKPYEGNITIVLMKPIDGGVPKICVAPGKAYITIGDIVETKGGMIGYAVIIDEYQGSEGIEKIASIMGASSFPTIRKKYREMEVDWNE